MKLNTTILALTLALVVGMRVISTAAAQPTTAVIGVTGDPAPDGNGSFTFFGIPALNDAGQVAFQASLIGTSAGSSDNLGIFRGDSVSGPVQIARKGQVAPDGNGDFLGFRPPALNDAGQVAFTAELTGTSGGCFDDGGIFRGDAVDALVQIAREGNAAPDGNGNFVSFDEAAPFRRLNNRGQVAFATFFTGTSGGSSDNSGVFRGDGVGEPVQIVREGQPVPGGNGTFSVLTEAGPALNDVGQVVFSASLRDSSDDRGIFRGDGVSSPVTIARAGQAAPDGNGGFFFFDLPVMNDAGQVTFSARLGGTSGGSIDDIGIFRSDGVSGVVQIARKGQAAPDGNGTFTQLSFVPALNDAGQVAFYVGMTGTSGGSSDNTGIFRGDEVTGLVQIVRAGQAAPDGNGSFSNLRLPPDLNDAGQVAFLADLGSTSGGSGDDTGLFFFDDALGPLQVAREGDALLGSTITGLMFSGVINIRGDERSGLNKVGQVAYQFELADGRQGIALWTIPEPSSLQLLPLSVVVLMFCRRATA